MLNLLSRRTSLRLAALALLAAPAAAHERWVSHQLLSPFDRELFESAGPLNLGLAALALVIVVLVAVLAARTYRAEGGRRESRPGALLADLAVLVLGAFYGISCLASAMSGEYLAPDLVGDGSPLAQVLVLGSGAVGLLLALGLFTRGAAWLGLVLYALALALRPFEWFDGQPVTLAAVFAYLDIIGIHLFLALVGRGRFSLDALFARRELVLDRRLATGILRLVLGLTLVHLGLQKFLHPELPMGVVQNYADAIYAPFERLLGVSEELYVFGAALVEVTVGLVLLTGAFTRVVMIVLAGLFSATLLIFKGELLGHLPLFGIVVLLLIEGGGALRLDLGRGGGGRATDLGSGPRVGSTPAALLLLATLLGGCSAETTTVAAVELDGDLAAGQVPGEADLARFELTFDVPAVGELFTVETRVVDDAGRPLAGVLELDCTMPSHGHGMMTAPKTRALGPGHFETAGMKLHMHGPWEFRLALESDAGRDVARRTYEQPPR